MGVRDGLGFEEVNQEVTDTEIISGTNVYASTKVVSPLMVATNLSGTTFSGTNFVNAEGELQSVSVGSPSSVFGAIIQAGSGTLSVDSGLWLVFPTTYTGQPTVVVSNKTSLDAVINAGSIGIGSFLAEGETASDEFSWIAVGL